MLISDEYKFVFVHVGKTGGDSITAALEPFARGEWTQASQRLGVKHLPARVIRARYFVDTDRTWQDFYRFALIRNPWDWLHSLWCYVRQMDAIVNGPTPPELKPWAESSDQALLQPERDAGNPLLAQRATLPFDTFVINTMQRTPTGLIAKYCCDAKGNQIVNRVFRYESLRQLWNPLCDRIGIGAVELPRHNPTLTLDGKPRGDYREAYTADLAERVAEHFAADIAFGGYEF